MAHKAEHFVAEFEEDFSIVTDKLENQNAPLSLWGEAWLNLRKRPLFIVSGILILFVLVVAILPQIFTSTSPDLNCQLANSNGSPTTGHPLGFTQQGCDVYSRLIFGTRASLLVGVLSTIGVVLLGGTIGAVAGFYGRWLDALLSRLGDIFFAIPLILGAIVSLTLFKDFRNVLTVSLILVIFGWPQVARITRSAVISVRNADFVMSARSLGVSRLKILFRHVLPNALAPLIVVATISLGTFIVAESTLSYLGIGLPPSTMSWGNDISAAQTSLRTNPMPLIYPALALSATVLSFIMMGDVIRDALDPKARKK